MPDSPTAVRVTALIAFLISSADSGAAEKASSVSDERQVIACEVATEQGDQRDVVTFGHAVGVTRTQPADDPGQERGKSHRLSRH